MLGTVLAMTTPGGLEPVVSIHVADAVVVMHYPDADTSDAVEAAMRAGYTDVKRQWFDTYTQRDCIELVQPST